MVEVEVGGHVAFAVEEREINPGFGAGFEVGQEKSAYTPGSLHASAEVQAPIAGAAEGGQGVGGASVFSNQIPAVVE